MQVARLYLDIALQEAHFSINPNGIPGEYFTDRNVLATQYILCNKQTHVYDTTSRDYDESEHYTLETINNGSPDELLDDMRELQKEKVENDNTRDEQYIYQCKILLDNNVEEHYHHTWEQEREMRNVTNFLATCIPLISVLSHLILTYCIDSSQISLPLRLWVCFTCTTDHHPELNKLRRAIIRNADEEPIDYNANRAWQELKEMSASQIQEFLLDRL